MNNKKLGNEFEKEVCAELSKRGYWVHFLSPDVRGAQPFDVIAVKNGVALAIDCKTSASHIFRTSRLEDNQVMAFDKWVACGNSEPLIAVKYNGHVYFVLYLKFMKAGKVDLDNERYSW